MTKKKAKMKGSPPKPENCPRHVEVQHRDDKLPWCDTCGWRREQPAVKLGTPRISGTLSDAPLTFNPLMSVPRSKLQGIDYIG